MDATGYTPDFSSVTTTLNSVAGEYGPEIALVFGIGAAIGIVSWGFPKLLGLFKKTAK